MTFSIPLWVLWLIGVPILVGLFLLAVCGAVVIITLIKNPPFNP